MAVDSENFKVVVTLLFSLSLLHLSLFHPIEAAPTEGNNKGAAGQLVPPSLPPIITKPNNFNPDETSTLPPPPLPLDLGPTTQPQLNGVAVTVIEESFLASTTESAISEMKLPGSRSDTELDHGLRTSASTGLLLYEVERDILGLSLDDVSYILTFGPEVFAYSLADKLGYLQKFNSGDDPHISIIDANKERLMEKLKNRMIQDNMQIITTKEPIFLEPITTTDPIHATARVPSQELSLGLSNNENNLVDPLTITKPDVEPTSQEPEVTSEITTESKTAEYYFEIITTAHDLVISTEDPHSNNRNSTPTNIVTEDNGAQDNSIHDNNMQVIAIEEKPSEDDESASRFFKQLLNDDEFLATLRDKNEEIYLKLNQGELDKEAASNLLDRYRVWVNDQMEDSHYGGPGGYYNNNSDDVMANEGNGIGTTELEGQEVKPEVQPEVEQGAGEGDNDREPVESESRPASNFGAVHFLVIFFIIGAIVVTGYLCVHNKKKIREGIGSYITDSSRYRRRAREYKPLKQAIADDIE